MDAGIGRHKIENYIIILIKWARVSKWSHVTIKDAYNNRDAYDNREVGSETFFNDDLADRKAWLYNNRPS